MSGATLVQRGATPEQGRSAALTRARAASPWHDGRVLLVLFFVLYAGVGAVLVFAFDSIMGDGLSRVANAYYVLFSRDPKLAAIGAVWTPLPSMAMLPFLWLKSLWPELVSLGYLANLQSAIAMALCVRVLLGALGELGLGRGTRVGISVLFGLNPVIVYYGANGMSEALLLLFLMVAVRSLVRWTTDRHPRHLVACGIGLAAGYLTRYEALAAGAFVVAFTYLVTFVTVPGTRHRRYRLALLDATIVGLPLFAAFALWALTTYAVKGYAFAQFSSEYGVSTALDVANGVRAAGGFSSLVIVLKQILILAPLLVPVALLVVVTGGRQRQLAGLVPLGVFGAILCFQTTLYLLGSSFGSLRYYIVAVPLLALLLGTLTTGNRRRLRRTAGSSVGVVVATAICTVTTGVAVLSQRELAYQEYVALHPIIAGEAIEAVNGVYEADRALAAQLDRMALPDGAVLVDTSSGFAPILASARPRQFVITSDEDFYRALDDPAGHGVQYLLVSRQQQILDTLTTQWPELEREGLPWARPVATFTRRQLLPSPWTWTLYQVVASPNPT